MGYAVWLYHRLPLSDRDVEELLLERGICVTRESIRTWCINFGDQFAQGFHHQEPRPYSRSHVDVTACGSRGSQTLAVAGC